MLVKLENIGRYFPEVDLFAGVNLQLNDGDRVGLVGPNGSGKSQLLAIIAGETVPDEGRVERRSRLRIGRLAQEVRVDGGGSVRDAALEVFRPLMELEAEIRRLEEALTHAAPDDLPELMARYGAAKDSYERSDGYAFRARAVAVLHGLGFGDADLDMPCTRLSGGQLNRLGLAQLLLQKPDLMLLDEPTNHLDIEVIEYLEEYLSATQATLFMVTHDRYFLDRVCNTIYELENGELFTYRGNYSLFLEKREERLANRAAETDKARNLYRRELQWIRSTPCARTGKSKSRLESFGKLKERIGPAGNNRAMEINAGIARLGTKIIHCKNLSFSFGQEPLLRDFTYNFSRNEKIGIVGGNGVGKTTFLKLLAGELEPLSGVLQHGTTVRFGFYRQEGISFNPGDTVFDVVHEIAEVVALADGSKVTATSFLSRFLFPPFMHQVKVERLSGGEKRRLYLLTILMRNPNFLILDEPTNDLDILTLNVLEEYLEHFKGCLLIVSHDRYFMDKLADHLFVFEGQGAVKDYPGKCSDYYRSRSAAAPAAAPAGRTGTAPARATSSATAPASASATASAQTVKKLTYRQRKRLEELEAEIQALEGEKSRLESLLSDPERLLTQITEDSVRMGEILARLEEDWEELLGLEDQRES